MFQNVDFYQINPARFCVIRGKVFSDLSALFGVFYNGLCSVCLVWINEVSNNCSLGDYQLKEFGFGSKKLIFDRAFFDMLLEIILCTCSSVCCGAHFSKTAVSESLMEQKNQTSS